MKMMHKVQLVSIVALVVGGAFAACAPEFRTECPEGKIRVGNGDVDEVCKYAAGAGGEGGGGAGGSAPVMGSGGSGGAPPGFDCNPGETKCGGDAQQTCNGEGKWGEAAACDIACDAQGSKCVVPVQLAAGLYHACALLSDGTVRCWGDNEDGQLGQSPSTITNSAVPVEMQSIKNATGISSAAQINAALFADGSAYHWGGIYPSSYNIIPTPLAVDNVKEVSVGEGVGGDVFSCVIASSGTGSEVKCRGANDVGQLGNNTKVDSDKFVPVQGILGAPKQVSAGENFACALTEEGLVFCWGSGAYNQNGNADAQDLLKASQVQGLGNVVQIGTGHFHACATKKDGVVLCWGSNGFKQLGRGEEFADVSSSVPTPVKDLTGVVRVYSANAYSCALKQDGTLWCWGVLGETSIFPVSAIAKKSDADGVVDVVLGGASICVLKSDNKAYCWGSNEKGQLGINQMGGTKAAPTPVVWR